MSRPKENWPPAPSICPRTIDYRLICRFYWSFLYVYGAGEMWNTSDGATRRHTDAMIGGDGTNFPQSLLPCTKISTARCKTILREWVCRLSYQEEEKRLKNEFAITTRATQTKNFSLKVMIIFVRFAYFHKDVA